MAIKASNQVSIIDVTDAYSVTLTSEAYTFMGNTSGAPSGLTCATQVIAYCGTTQCSKVTVSAVSCPSGISATITNNGSASPTVTFKTTATITAACEATIPVVVDGITINKKFSFSVAKQGSTGAKGDTGATGKGVKSTAVTYQAGATGTTAPTGSWSSSPPKTSAAAPYMWTRTIITYTDSTTSTSYSVGSTPEGIEVGGRNLLLNTADLTKWIPEGNVTVTKDSNGYFKISTTNTSSWWSTYQVITSVTAGQTYTLSGYSKKGTKIGYVVVRYYKSGTAIVLLQKSIPEGYFTIKFTVPSGADSKLTVYLGLQPTASGNYTYYKQPKLEKGNMATDWEPAPEDTDTKLEAKVDIDNLISQINASAEEIILTANRFTLESTNAKIDKTGKVNFSSGKIGGFEIGADYLRTTDSSGLCSFLIRNLPLDYDLSQADTFRLLEVNGVNNQGLLASITGSGTVYGQELRGKMLTATDGEIRDLSVKAPSTYGTTSWYNVSKALAAMTRRVVLEDSPVTSNSTVTLSDSVKNYDVIEVFYYDNDMMYGIVRFGGGGNCAFKMYSDNYLPSNGTWYTKYTQYEAKDNHLYFSSSYQRDSNGTISNGQFHTIYRVIGIKKGAEIG